MSETVTMTLTEFLLARIAEDEAVATDTQWLAFEYGVDSAGRQAFAARVLTECEAKRRVVETTRGWNSHNPNKASLHEEQVLGHLASVYAEHPDYREEWRP